MLFNSIIRLIGIVVILLILLSIFIRDIIITHNTSDNVLYAIKRTNHFSDNSTRNNANVNEVKQNQNQNQNQNQKIVSNKVVALTFGDIHKSRFTTAKPMLTCMALKVVSLRCEMVGKGSHKDWQDIETLYNEGHDIEAKADNDLTDLSSNGLDFQVSQPKKCL